MRQPSSQAVLLGALALVHGVYSIDPIEVPPSQYWEGNDGTWSTFGVQVGSQSSQLRLLPASGKSASWVVIPEGCAAYNNSKGVIDLSTCGQDRGGVFTWNESSTWHTETLLESSGVMNLDFWLESQLEDYLHCDYYCSGMYGYDNFTLGWPGSSLPTISQQFFAGIAITDIFIGTLGINPRPNNLTQNMSVEAPALLENLKDDQQIPSLSWAYTAGSYNSPSQTYGSLILGGYDTTRYEPNDLHFDFYTDISRDLLVGVQKITTNASDTPLMTTGEMFFIDSLVPYLYLPLDVCKAFEDAFGLTWNATAELYFVNDSLHRKLLNTNPSVTFTIGPTTASGGTIDIEIPYFNFDLQVKSPVYNVAGTQNYFPLKRATNNQTEYVLGRTFLQSAYVIVDYERSNFTVAKALYPTTGSDTNIVSILAPANMTNGTSPDSGSSSNSLSGGAIGGIAVAAVAIIAIVGVAFFFVYRKRRGPKSPDPDHRFNKFEMDATESAAGHGRPLLDKDGKPLEMAGDDNQRHEMEGDEVKELHGDEVKELHGDDQAILAKKGQISAELPANNPWEDRIFEMPANEEPRYEMESPAPSAKPSQPGTPRPPASPSPLSPPQSQGRTPEDAKSMPPASPGMRR